MTVTGNPAEFTVNGVAATVYSLAVPFSPIQDLNGYSNPWPAGGGKNMLNTVLTEGAPSDTTFGNATKRTFTVGTFVPKLTNNNYYNARANIQFSVLENSIKVTSSARAYAISIPIVGLTIGERYVFSCTKTNADNNTASFYKQDGTFISTTPSLTVCKFTVPEETYYTLLHFTPSANNVEATFTDIQLEKGSVPSSYAPYSNICPITGRTGQSVYVSPTQDVADATTYSVDWSTQAGTVYGGTLDVVTGVLTVDMANIASYNGEVINEPWLSSMDEYAPGATPTTGAQVVYELATPLTYQLTPQTINLLAGIMNYVWSDTGEDITISFDVAAFIRQLFRVNGVDFSRFVERDSYATSLEPVYADTIKTMDGVNHTALLRTRGSIRLRFNPQTDSDTAALCSALLAAPCEVQYRCLQRDVDVTALMCVDTISAQFLSRCLYLGDEWNQIESITLTEL